MNNWDVRPRMSVAVAGDNISPELLGLAVAAIAKDEGMTGKITKEEHNGNTYYLIASGGLDPAHIDHAISCLYDHMDNIDMSQHIGGLWGGCIYDKHSGENIECYGSMEDCMYVNVGSFDYYGPNVVVGVYYITD